MRILIALAIVLMAMGCANKGKAEDLAKEYVPKNYPGHEVVNVECQGQDSDQDGYCSCNVSLRKPDGSILIPPLECSYGWFQIWHKGCRVPKANVSR